MIKHPSKITTRLYSMSSSWAVKILDSVGNDLLRKEGIWFIVPKSVIKSFGSRKVESGSNMTTLSQQNLCGRSSILKPFIVVTVYCNWCWAYAHHQRRCQHFRKLFSSQKRTAMTLQEKPRLRHIHQLWNWGCLYLTRQNWLKEIMISVHSASFYYLEQSITSVLRS